MEPEGRLDIDTRWPELFDGLSEKQQFTVMQAFAASWHEGWIPNREDVENLTSKVRGIIDAAEYSRRVTAKARRVAAANEAK